MLAYSLIHVGLFVCFHINLYRVPKLKSYVMPHPAAKLDKSRTEAKEFVIVARIYIGGSKGEARF